MKIISVKLPDPLHGELETRAERAGVNKSDVVREALAEYFAEPEGTIAGSFLMQAQDLVGCVEGPEDLSFNPEHLHGYGR